MNGIQNYNALKTIIIKEYLRFIRIWVQTILPPAITTALYFVIFGNLIGSQVSDIDGYKYMDYIVPGLILMAVITNSYGNVVSSFYSAKFQKSIEELLVSPTPNALILIGYVSAGVVRGMIVGIIGTIVAMYFSDINIHSYTMSLLIFFLTATLFSIAGFINAVYANSSDRNHYYSNLCFNPLNIFRRNILFHRYVTRVLAKPVVD